MRLLQDTCMATTSWTSAIATAVGIENMGKGNKANVPSVFAGKAWQQVLARDTSADGQFVYAVKSTGIYCRPSCPSRRPERKNVSFFPNTATAEAAGFRACLRCEPQRVAPKADPQAEAIAAAADFLSEHAGQRTSLEDLAEAAGVGKFAVLRGFKRVLGVTPGEFARAQRKERFREEVRTPRNSRSPVTDAVYAAGFGSSSRLYEDADATLGMTPTAMKEGGAGETIRYAVADSPLGRILVATTDRGLCSVLFADSDTEAAVELRERFPQAVIRRDDQQLAETVKFVLARLGENANAAALPFHVRATAFQQRVWRALTEIPRGETRTYSQIAEAVGSPKSVRAVGAACGANPLALVVPCHRVVGSNGNLTGYRWGTERKRKLLEMEHAL
jgi:AraC family transcriptional regulator, regulatory protein of adaptative response / methylated-DNA-[protein]-cysteine methyltransferase